MTLDDLKKRVDDSAREQGQAETPRDVLESIEMDARRSVCEMLGAYFMKEYTIAITNGVGVVYNLTGPVNTDLLWDKFGRAVHEDTTEISILPFGCTSRDLTYPRFQGYYWGVIENSNTITTITVWYGGGGAVADGNVTIDFGAVLSLASWPVIHEAALVAKCAEMLSPQQAVAGE